jgi:hypothetical protein
MDPAKWYVARVVQIADDEVPFQGRPQPKYRFDFIVLDPPEFAGRELDGLVNQPQGGELNERHTLYDWITVLRGGVPLSIGDEIDFPDQFVGQIVLVNVESKTKQYDAGKQPFTFQNVKRLAICQNAQAYEHLYPLADVLAARASAASQTAAAQAPAQPAAAQPAAAPSPSPTPAPQGAPTAAPAQPAPAATQPPAPAAGGVATPAPTTPAAPAQPAPDPARPAPVEPPAQPAPAQPAPQAQPPAPAGGAEVQVNGKKKKVPF